MYYFLADDIKTFCTIDLINDVTLMPFEIDCMQLHFVLLN
jgi:hypothetical protein